MAGILQRCAFQHFNKCFRQGSLISKRHPGELNRQLHYVHRQNVTLQSLLIAENRTPLRCLNGQIRLLGGTTNDDLPEPWAREDSGFGEGTGVTIQVAPHLVGLIIGMGGQTIHRLEDDSGAMIKVSHERNNDDKVNVELSGTEEQVARAKQLIEEVTSSNNGGTHVQFRVDAHLAGRIIGAGGSIINELQGDSGARIDVSRDEQNTTVGVDLSGTEEQVAIAKQRIEKLIGGVVGSTGDGNVKIQVDQYLVGRIIGVGGRTINKLRQDSGALIQVSSENNDGKVDVALGGTGEQVARVKQLIEELLEDASGITLQVEKRYIGQIIGKSGSMIREIRNESGSFISVGSNRTGATVDVMLGGTEEQVARAKQLIENITEYTGEGEATLVKIQVESHNIGRIIGRGGSVIRQLKEDSGADIYLNQGEFGDMCDVELKGSEEQVARAKQLIENIVTNQENYVVGDFPEPSVTIQIAADEVGLIIGRGGSKIRELQDVSGAHIKVSNDRVDDKVDVLLGGTEEQVARAKQLIEEMTTTPTDRHSIELLVDTQMVGLLIGPGGSQIDEIEDDSGARIEVSREPNDGKTSVRLIGSDESVARAKQLVEKLTDI